MITNSATMIPIVVADPSSSAKPLNPMRVRPATNCSTPKPKVCATPKMVATTATMSMMWPRLPDSALPKSGVSDERIVSGKPRR